MRAAPFVILAIVLSGCAPKSTGTQSTSPEKLVSDGKGQPKDKIVDVEIVVATHQKNLETCKSTNKPARTIYVDIPSGQVSHCMGPGKLLAHTNHGQGHSLSDADVPLSAGQQIRWFSTTHTFVVVSVEKGKELPQSPLAPPTPFAAAFAKVPAREVTSSEVPSIEGEVVNATRSRSTSPTSALSTRT